MRKPAATLCFLFLFAMAGQPARAQIAFTASPASPSPTANVVEALQFSGVQNTNVLFEFVITTPSAGETMDAGIYTVSGGTATLYKSLSYNASSLGSPTWTCVPSCLYYQAPFFPNGLSLANATSLSAGNVAQLTLPCPNANSCTVSQELNGSAPLVNSNLIFAMCSSGTTAQVEPYMESALLEQSYTLVGGNLVPYFVNTFGRVWMSLGEYVGTPTGPYFFSNPWASDSNWSSDSVDLCTNGILPQTITLANLVEN